MSFNKAVLGAAFFAAVTSPLVSAEEQQKQMEEVIITSSRVETPLRRVGSTVSVITSSEIEERGHATLVDVLRSETGISVTSSGGLGKASSLRIRGEAGYRTLVLVDGVDVSDPTGTQVGPQIQHILASEIDRVEILRGPQGMVYGADAGGVINIITRGAGEELSGNFNVEHGRYDTTRLSGNVRGKAGLFDYSLSISDVDSEGFNARTIDPSEDKDGYKNTTINAVVGADVADNWRLQLVVRDVDAESEFDGFSSLSNHDQVSYFDQTNYKLSADYKSENLAHSFSYGYTDVERENKASGISSFATEGSIDQIQYLGSWNVGAVGKLIFGADYEKEDIVSSSNVQFDRSQLGLYAEWQGVIGENFYYTAGVRNDDNDDFGSHNSVRLTSAYLIQLGGGDELKLKASYGTGFRAPALSELAYNSGPWAFGAAAATQLMEEESEGFDVGVEYFGANGVTAELVYFDQDIEDEIFFDLASFSGYLQETGLSRSKGIELTTEYPVSETLSLTGNYTYTSSRDIEGNQRRRVPQEVYNLGVRLRLAEDKLRISANMRWVRDVVDGAVQLDDYQVLDITANYQMTEGLAFYMRAENTLDEEYQEINTYFSSRAAYYGGVRYSF